MNRREFLQTVGAVGLWMWGWDEFISWFRRKKEACRLKRKRSNQLKEGLVVAEGDDPYILTKKAIEVLGGIECLVKKGDVAVVKPNMAWDRVPECAANTNPDVVRAVVELCVAVGAKVKVFDRTCSNKYRAYKNSGIAEAAESAGAEVKFVDEGRFFEVEILQGRVLKRWSVYGDALDADVLINIPIAKHHSSAKLSLGMKNLMGIIGGNRGLWHINLHQYIADFSTLKLADLTILDAFRILTRHGPSGGNLKDVEMRNQIIAGSDPVAVDAYGATLFGLKPEDIDYIRYAHQLGVGEMDLAKIDIKEISL
jgi:uncharacterized protein (DUF362 family)